MRLELKLAYRYFRSRGRRAARVGTWAGVGGIAAGVAALIFAQALATGFRDELQSKLLRGAAHLTVQRTDGASLENAEVMRQAVQRVAGVTGAALSATGGGLVQGPAGATFGVLRAVDTQSPSQLSLLCETLREGKCFDSQPLRRIVRIDGKDADEPQVTVLLGAGLAARLGVGVGGRVSLLTADLTQATGEIDSLSPRTVTAQVSGLFESGLRDFDASGLYLTLGDFERVTGQRATSLGIEITTPDAPDTVARSIQELVGSELSVTDWRTANAPLFAAMQLERRVITLIIGLILLVAVLNVTTTLVLVVTERRNDLAILLTMGLLPRRIVTIFLLQGTFIGVTGTAVGLVLGTVAAWMANHWRLIRLPAEIYAISYVPLHLRASDLTLATVGAVLLAILAAAFPAIMATRTRPAEILRGN